MYLNEVYVLLRHVTILSSNFRTAVALRSGRFQPQWAAPPSSNVVRYRLQHHVISTIEYCSWGRAGKQERKEASHVWWMVSTWSAREKETERAQITAASQSVILMNGRTP